MSAESVVYNGLLADAGVAALVGARIHHKIIPLVAPPQAQPTCIAYVRSATQYLSSIHQSPPIAENVSIEVHCISASDAGAAALAEAVLAVPATEWHVTDRRDDYDPDTQAHSTVVTVEVFVL